MAPEGGESVADVANRLLAVLSSTETDFHRYISICTYVFTEFEYLFVFMFMPFLINVLPKWY